LPSEVGIIATSNRHPGEGVVNKAVLLVLAALPLCAQAEMYRWVDENGKVIYGDRPMGKEVKRVNGLREPKAVEAMPAPGMKADDLRKIHGEPDRVQKISTKSGETQIWTYRKSKQVARDCIVKIEGGEVVEVQTDSAATSRPAVSAQESAADAQARTKAAAEDAYRSRQASVMREAEQKEQRCAVLRENLRRLESQERSGGSAASMDSLREQRRQASDRLWSSGC
jgi:hypothetical protein